MILQTCPKCHKKKFYFRAAFASWKCYSCGFEKEEPTVYLSKANIWWAYLSSEKKIEIWLSFSKQTSPDKTECS